MTDTTNLAIWQQVEKTDPKFTKEFSRGGGFKGTATNATWLAKRATETFGPIGIGWGVEIEDESYVDGHEVRADNGAVLGRVVIHKLRARLWYMWNGAKGSVVQFGQTEFIGRNKNGWFTDEEAPKKSLTDATSKCLSLIGFAADVHMGMFDDNKYVNDRNQEEAQKKRQQAPKPQAAQQPADDKPFGFKNRNGGRDTFTNVTSYLDAVEEILDDPENPLDDKKGFAGANYDEMRAVAAKFQALKKANPRDEKIAAEYGRLVAVGKKVGQYLPTQTA